LETTKRMFRVKREDIHYLRTTIEAYDGMAVVRTVESADPGSQRGRVDPGEATIELLIAPGCEGLISALIAALREQEGLPLEPVTA
jgi:hypothetical protein